MKEFLKNLLVVFIIIAVVVTPFFVYIEVNKNELIFVYELYDDIQYHEYVYYRLKGSEYVPPYEGGEERGPVYLIKASKVYKKNSYTAYVYTGYEGEEEEIYLHFDEGIYIRGDYITEEIAVNLFWSNR